MQSGNAAWALARLLVTFAVLTLCATGHASAKPTEKARCFNVDGLSPPLREKSEALLLEALDTEHLFTLVSGLKPMSAGFFSAKASVSAPDMDVPEADAVIAAYGDADADALDAADRAKLETARAARTRSDALQEIEDVRSILATWRCGEQIQADLVHYATSRGGDRQLHAVVFALPSVRQLLTDKAAFFSRWAFTPSASPLEVLSAVEYARDVTRFGGYGYLFGYPDEAVQFFVVASTVQDVTGKFVERDFRAIPTFQRDDGQFTYAVARGQEETAADRELRARASKILEAYKARRSDYIGEGKPGAAALLRDWFCPSEDRCSPANAAL